MKPGHRYLILSAALVFGLLLVLPTPSEAGHGRPGWTVGGHFSTGHHGFSIYYDPYDLEGGFFFRTGGRLGYRGYSCTDACYLDSGYYYHEPYCPVVAHHFRLFGFHPIRVLKSIFGWSYHHYYPHAYGSHRYYRGDRYYKRYPYRGHHYRDRYRHYRYDRRHGHYGRRGYSHADSDSDSDRRYRWRRRGYSHDDSDSDRRRRYRDDRRYRDRDGDHGRRHRGGIERRDDSSGRHGSIRGRDERPSERGRRGGARDTRSRRPHDD